MGLFNASNQGVKIMKTTECIKMSETKGMINPGYEEGFSGIDEGYLDITGEEDWGVNL